LPGCHSRLFSTCFLPYGNIYHIFAKRSTPPKTDPGTDKKTSVVVKNHRNRFRFDPIRSINFKAAFTPSLLYTGTRPVEGLEVLGDFQWYYRGLTEGSVFGYLYQALVPEEFNFNFSDVWIYTGCFRCQARMSLIVPDTDTKLPNTDENTLLGIQKCLSRMKLSRTRTKMGLIRTIRGTLFDCPLIL
jgi:hypothetical protein